MRIILEIVVGILWFLGCFTGAFACLGLIRPFVIGILSLFGQEPISELKEACKDFVAGLIMAFVAVILVLPSYFLWKG